MSPTTMSRNPAGLTNLSCIVRVLEETQDAAIDQAMALAAETGAHLHVAICAQKTSLPGSPFGAAFVGPLVADLNAKTLERAQTIEADARERARKAGVNAGIRVSLAPVDTVATEAVTVARASDLIVVDPPVAMLDTKGLILEEALFRSGRPVLVASAKRPPVARVRRILVAWDGSAHVARALGDALALFPSIATAEILTVTGEKSLGKGLPAGDLAHHRAGKGIETILTEKAVGPDGVAAVIDRQAVQSGADLIVMGGFGHSRFREFIFGGVTVALTEGASVPLLMAY